MYYYQNRRRAQFKNTDPSMTDQSQAKFTDINIIVARINSTGMMPATKQGFYGDLADLPRDLRGFLELGRSMEEKRKMLPIQLRHMSTQQLLELTPEELTTILTPPAPPAPTEDKK